MVTGSRVDLHLLVLRPDLSEQEVRACRLAERVVLAMEYEEGQAD